MIEVRGLEKAYGSFRAVKGLTFDVEAGEVVGFLGPNGAGKSTTLRILSGYLGPTKGDVKVDGISVVDDPVRAKQRIGYMPETSPLYPEMKVGEYLRFRAELKGVRSGDRKAAVRRALVDAGLDDWEGVLIGHLSKGYRQRVGLADALVASPPLLILDEPTAGLDPNQIREVRSLITRLKDKHTIVLSTHILSEVEAVSTRAIVIAKGQLVAQGSLDELYELRRASAVRLRLRGERDVLRREIAKIDGVRRVDEVGAGGAWVRLEVTFDSAEVGEETTERVVAKLIGAGAGVLEVVPQSSLEQVFSELTRDDDAGAAA
jgi:ABC-2 type transport system ATP-binding protein